MGSRLKQFEQCSYVSRNLSVPCGVLVSKFSALFTFSGTIGHGEYSCGVGIEFGRDFVGDLEKKTSVGYTKILVRRT